MTTKNQATPEVSCAGDGQAIAAIGEKLQAFSYLKEANMKEGLKYSLDQAESTPIVDERRKEVHRLEQMRDRLVEEKEKHERQIKNPINKRTGKALSESTVKRYRNEISQHDRSIEKHGKEIERLKNSCPDSDDFLKLSHPRLALEADILIQKNLLLEERIASLERKSLDQPSPTAFDDSHYLACTQALAKIFRFMPKLKFVNDQLGIILFNLTELQPNTRAVDNWAADDVRKVVAWSELASESMVEARDTISSALLEIDKSNGLLAKVAQGAHPLRRSIF